MKHNLSRKEITEISRAVGRGACVLVVCYKQQIELVAADLHIKPHITFIATEDKPDLQQGLPPNKFTIDTPAFTDVHKRVLSGKSVAIDYEGRVTEVNRSGQPKVVLSFMDEE